MNFTALTYIKLQFIGKWKRAFATTQLLTEYLSEGPEFALLFVVSESAVGTLETYVFEVAANEQVWVNTGTNVVQIPSLCINKKPGDITECFPNQRL
jgi:hypothetical protein